MDAVKRPERANRKFLVLILLLISPLLTACSEEGADLLVDMAIEWASSKKLIRCEPAGDPNCELGLNMVELGKYAVGWGSDPNVQAMVDTGKVVNDINNADELAEEGFTNGDPQKLQEAIQLRPGDWSYDQQLSVVYLAQGEAQEASAAEVDSETKVQDHIKDTLEKEGLAPNNPQAHDVCSSSYFNMYKHREESLLAEINKSPEPSPEIMNQLVAQLDLVRSRMAGLDAPSSPCAGYGG